jgi:hypothetical protein
MGSGNYFLMAGKVTNKERNFDSFGLPDWEVPFERNRNRNMEEKEILLKTAEDVHNYMRRKFDQLDARDFGRIPKI